MLQPQGHQSADPTAGCGLNHGNICDEVSYLHQMYKIIRLWMAVFTAVHIYIILHVHSFHQEWYRWAHAILKGHARAQVTGRDSIFWGMRLLAQMNCWCKIFQEDLVLVIHVRSITSHGQKRGLEGDTSLQLQGTFLEIYNIKQLMPLDITNLRVRSS